TKDFDLNTTANAVFAENAFFILPKLKIVPGIRYENIQSSIDGYLNYFLNQTVNVQRTRNVLLLGSGVEYEYLSNHFIKLNYTQNFRPVLYSELIPPSTTDVVDEKIKDMNGSVSEISAEGVLLKDGVYYNISAFYMEYKDKIGTILKDGKNFRTNIGDAINKGIEILIDGYLLKCLNIQKPYDVNIYYAGTFQNFKYTRWDDPATFNTSKNLVGKSVEYAPDFIHRTGVKFLSKYVDISYQKQFYSDVFTDAMNTDKPNATATIGKIKGFTIDDITMNIKLHKWFSLSTTINNIFDVKYATRRAGGYPGPGLMPGNGRNWLVSIGFKW
ncbi:MAG: TonB-dependent receptor, partial [Bacteroidia bacterium]|nr:TonB-dependent receptor [Bacteroidia bacterium]